MALRPISLIQGNSYEADLKSRSGSLLSITWSGTWAIVSALGSNETPLSDGELLYGLNGEYLALRLLSADTIDIPIGKYFLIIKVSDSATNYNKEIIQLPLTITAKGIPVLP